MPVKKVPWYKTSIYKPKSHKRLPVRGCNCHRCQNARDYRQKKAKK